MQESLSSNKLRGQFGHNQWSTLRMTCSQTEGQTDRQKQTDRMIDKQVNSRHDGLEI